MTSRGAVFNRWPGIWPGTVMSDEDPEHKGRLQIRIDQIYGAPDETEKVEDAQLPWAMPLFASSGANAGEFHVPPVGATVWTTFWGGHQEKPVWIGGWFTSDDVMPEAASSYDPGPKTRIIRTAGGHSFEMRWKKDEEQIYLKTASGNIIKMSDADALGGPKIDITTPDNFKITLDDVIKKIEALTPGNRRILLDDDNQKITIETPTRKIVLDDDNTKILVDSTGDIEVQATQDVTTTVVGNTTNTMTGTLLSTIVGAVSAVFASTVTLTVAALYSLTAASISLTGAMIDLVGTITLGLAGPKFKLMDERFIAFFNTHVHVGPFPGPTSPPFVPLVPGTANTLNTTAN